MNQQEFLRLRDSSCKTISEDIQWKKEPGTKPSRVFTVAVNNSFGLNITLNGRYNPITTSVVYNFVVNGIGAICRVCVRGQIHKPAGRTHKHHIQNDDDVEHHLSTPCPRPDLEALNAREIWRTLCADASIVHTGTFHDPV